MTAPHDPPELLDFGGDGLIPAVIQDVTTDRVLMVGFMNREAFECTRATKRVHFWSRSRQKLWKKGETSGHEQLVDEIFVNCEDNSLLITVRQLGATCHTGFPTCYYRRLNEDDSLTVVYERVFDPAEIYTRSDGESLEAQTRRWYDAYRYLASHDLSAVSRTSMLLHDPNAAIHPRVADELRELAGVLCGEHRHVDLTADTVLEGSQSLYWLALVAARSGISWEELRPDRALVTASDEFAVTSAANLLLAEANRWSRDPENLATLAAQCHAAMALVAQASRSVGLSPATMIQKDLADLSEKPYLAAYFSAP